MSSFICDISNKQSDDSSESEKSVSSVLETVPIPFSEAHFFTLPSQGNIYTMSLFDGLSGDKQLMVASLKRKVFWLEVTKDQDEVGLNGRELAFSHLPSSSEIVSMDVFSRNGVPGDLVVALTLVKEVDRGSAVASNSAHFLNVYSEWQQRGADGAAAGEHSHSSCSSSSQTSCHYQQQQQQQQSQPLQLPPIFGQLQLNFVSYQLTHASARVNGTEQTVLLLGGSDCAVHVFYTDIDQGRVCELPASEFFPELCHLPSVPMWIEFRHDFSWCDRVSAVACECGAVRVTCVTWRDRPTGLSLTGSWSCTRNDLITSLRLFSTSAAADDDAAVAGSCCNQLQLLVTCAQLPAAVLKCHVTRESKRVAGDESERVAGESEMVEVATLPACADLVTCSCLADVNMDGVEEVLLGTYSQELLVYACDEAMCWTQVLKLTFTCPLLAIGYTDLIGDGVNELCVFTTHGLHVLQHDLEKTSDLINKRLAVLDEDDILNLLKIGS